MCRAQTSRCGTAIHGARVDQRVGTLAQQCPRRSDDWRCARIRYTAAGGDSSSS